MQQYTEGKGNGSGGTGSTSAQPGHSAGPGQSGSRPGHNNVATPAGSSGNHHGPMGSHDMFKHASKPNHSDGEEDDMDDLDDDDHSPDSR